MKLCKPLLEHDPEISQPILAAFESLSDANRFSYPNNNQDYLRTIYFNILNWTHNLIDMDETSEAYSEIVKLVNEMITKLDPPLQYATRKMLFDD